MPRRTTVTFKVKKDITTLCLIFILKDIQDINVGVFSFFN